MSYSKLIRFFRSCSDEPSMRPFALASGSMFTYQVNAVREEPPNMGLILETLTKMVAMLSTIGNLRDYMLLGCADLQKWFAILALPGYALLSLGPTNADHIGGRKYVYSQPYGNVDSFSNRIMS